MAISDITIEGDWDTDIPRGIGKLVVTDIIKGLVMAIKLRIIVQVMLQYIALHMVMVMLTGKHNITINIAGSRAKTKNNNNRIVTAQQLSTRTLRS